MKKEIFLICCAVVFIFYTLAQCSKKASDEMYKSCVEAGIHKNEQCYYWAYLE